MTLWERKEKENLRIQQEKIDQTKTEALNKNSDIITASSSVRKFKPVGKIDLDFKKNLPKDKKSIENEDKNIIKKDADKDSTNDKNSNEEKLPLDNEKLTTNYKKIIAPVKTGETVDLDKIKEQEKNVEASRKKKRKRIVSKESNQKKPPSETNRLKKSLKKVDPGKVQNLKVEPQMRRCKNK